MKLKAVLKSLEGLDEAVAALYLEVDGKFILQVESVDGYALENVVGLKSGLSKERDNVKSLTTKLEAFGNLDANAARDALVKVEDMKNWTPEEKVKEQIAAREQKLLEKHGREIVAKDERIGVLTMGLQKHLVKASAVAAVTKHKGNAALLLPHVMNRVKVEEHDGEFFARVLDSDGQTTRVTMKTGSTDPMSIDEMVELMREEDTFAPAFEGKGQTGTGLRPASKGGKGSSGIHRITNVDAHDPAKYRAAKAAAAEAGTTLQVDDHM